MIGELNTICLALIGSGLSDEAIASGWLWLVPTASAQASYSPVVFLLVIAAVFGLTFLVVRYFYHGRLRRADAWDCGFPAQTSRMQDSADAFGQPIRQIFAPVYLIQREIPRADDPHPVFRQSVEDRHWYAMYLPIARFTEFLSAAHRQTATGAHFGVSAVQLRNADRIAGVRAMNIAGGNHFPGAAVGARSC